MPRRKTAEITPSFRVGDPFNPFGLFNGILIPEALLPFKSLSAGAKLVYGRLARYAGQDGKCYPAVPTLATEIGMSVRQTQNYLRELERQQLIKRRKRFSDQGQQSNDFQFLWHPLFDEGVKSTAPEGVQDLAPEGVQDSAYKESHSEESNSEENKHDIDCLPLNRKKRDSTAGHKSPSVCAQYPNVREALARYMQLPGDVKEYPSDRTVVDILEAAGTYDEREVIAALKHLYKQRGLEPSTKHGPRCYRWFATVLEDHFTKKRDREAAANPSGYHEWEDRNHVRFMNQQFGEMTDALELPDVTQRATQD